MYAHFIPPFDPDMTPYEDINQMILIGNSELHGAKRNLELAAPSSQPVTLNELCDAEKLKTRDEEVEADYEPVPVLNPEDVFRTGSDINGEVCEAEALNCSAINASSVSLSNSFF